jgi:hypothetical protein
MKKLFATLCVLFCCAAWAGDLEDGVAAHDKKDYKKALIKLNQAAQQGSANAMAFLGYMYFFGDGVLQDYRMAVRWYTDAAERGNSSAQGTLGVIYQYGKGVAQDYKTAVRWYKSAAEQGDADAQSGLGSLYSNGHGVLQDNCLAHMWYNIAAAKGDGTAIKNRKAIEKLMSPQQIERAQQMARDCQARNYKKCD